MQNRYVGDVGDFGKCGLSRYLTGQMETPVPEPALKLGVVRYLYPDESHNADGKHTGYLDDTSDNYAAYRACDPHLYRRVAYSLKASLALPRLPISLIYRRGSARAYFVVPRKADSAVLECRVAALLDSQWNAYFEWVE